MAKKSKSGEGKGFIIGAAVGAIVGSVTALLFAPQSGKETREDIVKAAKHVGSELDKKRKELEGAMVRLKGTAAKEGAQLLKQIDALKAELSKKPRNSRKKVQIYPKRVERLLKS